MTRCPVNNLLNGHMASILHIAKVRARGARESKRREELLENYRDNNRIKSRVERRGVPFHLDVRARTVSSAWESRNYSRNLALPPAPPSPPLPRRRKAVHPVPKMRFPRVCPGVSTPSVGGDVGRSRADHGYSRGSGVEGEGGEAREKNGGERPRTFFSAT